MLFDIAILLSHFELYHVSRTLNSKTIINFVLYTILNITNHIILKLTKWINWSHNVRESIIPVGIHSVLDTSKSRSSKDYIFCL